MDSGWIRIYRKIRDNPLWPSSRRFTPLEAWLDVLMSANHAPAKNLHGISTLVPVERGQFITSQVKLAERWRWNRKTVKKFLLFLKKNEMLDIETKKGADIGFTLITIRNYRKYQDKENDTLDIEMGSKGTSDGLSNGLLLANNKNEKKGKKEEGYEFCENSPPSLPSTTTGQHGGNGDGSTGHHGGFHAHGFVELYASSAPSLRQPRQVTNGRMRKIGQRLKTHPSRAFWQDVFSRANQTPFLKGENDREWKADLDWFVANDENAVKVLEGKYDPARGGGRKPEPDPWAKY